MLDGQCQFVDATSFAPELTGDAISANLIILGAAYQQGLIPLRAEAIEQAIKLNGVAVEKSLDAFAWGRLFVAEPDRLSAIMGRPLSLSSSQKEELDVLLQNRRSRLQAYHNGSYAAFADFMKEIAQRDQAEDKYFTKAVAKGLYKMMAIKDEYEVARLSSMVRFLTC